MSVTRRNRNARRSFLADRRREEKSSFYRRIFFEPLEDRRLLAITLTGVPNWIEQGPGPALHGSALVRENGVAVPGPAAGAIEAIAPHPANPDIVFVAAVNGGVWRTTNATLSPREPT